MPFSSGLCIFIILNQSKKSNSAASGHFRALNVLFFEMFGVHSARLFHSNQTYMTQSELRATPIDWRVGFAYDAMVVQNPNRCTPRVNKDEAAEILAFTQHLRGDRRVLDVGCGLGGHAAVFLQANISYIGIDVSSKALEVAQKSVSGATFKTMSVCKLEFPDAYFDGIWCFMSIHHLPKFMTDSALRSLRRVLRPGGVGFITVLDGNSDAGAEVQAGGVFAYIARYQALEFAGMLKQAGFNFRHSSRTFSAVADHLVHSFLIF